MESSVIQQPSIGSKLHRLRISSQTVLRPRLLEQLADATGLVLVIASAPEEMPTLPGPKPAVSIRSNKR